MNLRKTTLAAALIATTLAVTIGSANADPWDWPGGWSGWEGGGYGYNRAYNYRSCCCCYRPTYAYGYALGPYWSPRPFRRHVYARHPW